ncbi:MAG TPA: hypothetical protein VFZ78_13475 [Flavisolibacter sp.]
MKQGIWILAAITTLAAMSCRKIEADGEREVIIINGGGPSTGQTITLEGRITADTILRKQNRYILKGLVYMANNKTMTIEAGTKIEGSYAGSDVAALVITRGSKIMAQGTANEPIVFTSASPNPQSGDWGGLVILGKAPINTSYNGTSGLFEVEGGINNAQGDGLAGSGDAVAPTPVPNDNSGVISYVRIEYAGYAFQPDKEVNSLTMAGVGSGTTIDHVQVSYAKDDAFEWFGGTVNAKYLIAWKTQDDDFDTDNGYSGRVQFGLVIRDSLIADISTSEAFESDNNSSGSSVTPKTSAVFSNITAIGPRATLANSGSSYFRAGGHIRRNTSLSIFNSIIMGWPAGFQIDASTGVPVDRNIEDSTLRIRYTTLAGNTTAIKYSASSSAPTGWNDAAALSWFQTPAFGNTILTNATDAKLIQPFNYTNPDPTPFAGSSGYQPIVSGGNFTDLKLQDPFFTVVNFRGAVAPAGTESTWWKGWTRFN